jgi:hypothetical protein
MMTRRPDSDGRRPCALGAHGLDTHGLDTCRARAAATHGRSEAGSDAQDPGANGSPPVLADRWEAHR